ncbi:hypothetical protein [Haloplanus halobius]|uniref:hypothetical protein n=1 Tax=Haloplanus halobius TaxID=2934938 RepID=UPI00200BA2B8|nr:hypothetical protein [Haloplanus sp. XH21]
MSLDSDVDTEDAPIDDAVVVRVAERAEMDPATIATALVTVNAELLGRHAEFERSADYVTVDNTRAYRISYDRWDDVLAAFEFDSETGTAVRTAHTEQARLLFATAVGVDDQFGADEAGAVVGIDTAEQF